LDIWGLLVLPLGFGLIGFVTPCSLGVNIVLLGYMAGRNRRQRLLITSSFTLVRR
jgi:cytochrome c-type biogenesis protein